MFQVPQQGRGVLDFIDDQRFGKSVQQFFRRAVSGLGVDRQIQAEIGGPGVQVPQNRCFSGLPGAGDQNGRKLCNHAFEQLFNMSRYPHADNMHQDCKLFNHSS